MDEAIPQKAEIDELTRTAVFALKFQGKEVKDDQIFKSIPAFSPIGRPKTLACTEFNIARQKKYLDSINAELAPSETDSFCTDATSEISAIGAPSI